MLGIATSVNAYSTSEFEIDIPEDSYILSLDRLQFSRVVTNLINNALKHNEAGTTISLEMKKEKDKIQSFATAAEFEAARARLLEG
mgnify:CR=1 FL=1